MHVRADRTQGMYGKRLHTLLVCACGQQDLAPRGHQLFRQPEPQPSVGT
jgi:hypothetical protein